MQQAADVHQLATLYADSLIQHLPAGPCTIAGVGLSSMVAFEVTLQLYRRRKQVQLLTVFESVPVSLARLALPVLGGALTGELVHVWCALYHLILESASQQHPVDDSGSSQHLGGHDSSSSQRLQLPQQQLPELRSMMTHLHSLQSYEAQLDYISSFRPATMEPQLWDSKVHEILTRALHLMQLLHGYQPRESLRCPVLVVHELREQEAPLRIVDSLAQVVEDSWKNIASALLPVMTCSMRAEADADVSSAALVSVLDSLIVAANGGSDVTAATLEPLEPTRIGNQSAVALPLNSLCPGLCPDNRYKRFPCAETITNGIYTSVRTILPI